MTFSPNYPVAVFPNYPVAVINDACYLQYPIISPLRHHPGTHTWRHRELPRHTLAHVVSPRASPATIYQSHLFFNTLAKSSCRWRSFNTRRHWWCVSWLSGVSEATLPIASSLTWTQLCSSLILHGRSNTISVIASFVNFVSEFARAIGHDMALCGRWRVDLWSFWSVAVLETAVFCTTWGFRKHQFNTKSSWFGYSCGILYGLDFMSEMRSYIYLWHCWKDFNSTLGVDLIGFATTIQ